MSLSAKGSSFALKDARAFKFSRVHSAFESPMPKTAQYVRSVCVLSTVTNASSGYSNRMGVAAKLFKSGANRLSCCKISSFTHRTTGVSNVLGSSSRPKLAAFKSAASCSAERMHSSPVTMSACLSGCFSRLVSADSICAKIASRSRVESGDSATLLRLKCLFKSSKRTCCKC